MSDRPGGPDWWLDGDGRWYPPPTYPPPPWPPPPLPGSGGPGRRPSAWGFWVAIGAVLLVAGMVAGALALARSPRPSGATFETLPPSPGAGLASPTTQGQPGRSGPVPGATGAISPDEGTIAFSDDFADPTSGWTTDHLPSGTTFAYEAGHYVVVAHGSLHHFAVAPYEIPIEKLSVLAVATQSLGAPDGAGFGVLCAEDGNLDTGVRYEFLALDGGQWFVERRTGAGKVVGLRQGAAPAAPGAHSLRVEGVCNTLKGGRSTRLVMFVDGRRVADFEDTTGNLPGQGWVGGIDVASRSQSTSAVTFSEFEEKDLSG